MEDYRLRLQWLRKTNRTADLVRMLNVSETALSAYESGRRVPRDEVQARIAQAVRRQKERTQPVFGTEEGSGDCCQIFLR